VRIALSSAMSGRIVYKLLAPRHERAFVEGADPASLYRDGAGVRQRSARVV
jgi:hypothetical protein